MFWLLDGTTKIIFNRDPEENISLSCHCHDETEIIFPSLQF